jgi:hypothetical protein
MLSFYFFSFMDFGIVFEPFALLIVSFLQKISGQHIPEGMHMVFEERVVLS